LCRARDRDAVPFLIHAARGKARLEVRDWSMVFKDVDQAKLTKYEEGDFQSLTFDQAVKRPENICDQAIKLPSCGATSRRC
jgi:hypothetical protein